MFTGSSSHGAAALRRGLWLVAALLPAMVIGQEGPVPEDGGGEAVAIVNGEKILRKDLGDELIAMLGRPALERMIRLRLVEQEARKYGVEVAPEELNDRLEAAVAQGMKKWYTDNGMKNEAEFDRFLQQTRGITLEMARNQTKAELRMPVKAEILAEKVLNKVVTVSPQDVQDAYDAKYGTTIRARQIVLATRSEAEELLGKLKAGADFELLARESSIDAATRSRGGEMRPLSGNSALGHAVMTVQPGGLSEIVRTDDGYHILKVIERDEKKKVKIEDVEAALRAEILKKRMEERKATWQTQLLERAQIKVLLPGATQPIPLNKR